MTSALVPLLLGLQQIALPAPRGYINDFAGVLDSASIAHMQAVIADVREKTRGEIVLVTLPDIGDRQAADVAVQIGRQRAYDGRPPRMGWWCPMASDCAAGEPAPLERHRPASSRSFGRANHLCRRGLRAALPQDDIERAERRRR